MRIELLKNIAEIIAGQSPPSDTYNKTGEGIPFFQGMADYGNKFPNIRNWCSKPTKISLPNDILISVRAPVGPVNINNVEACVGRGLSAIRVKDNFSHEYLYYFLKENEKQISKLGVGSTFTAITQKDLGNIKITIPNTLSDQIKIATILSKAETLINQRKENIELLDAFLKSTFLKMFFPFFQKINYHKLETLCTKITDGTHDTPERLKQGVKFITGKHIRPYVIDFDNSDYVTEEVHKEIYRRCNPEFGDILYTNIGVNLGTAAMNNVNFEFSMKNVALLKLNQSLITPRYLEHYLNLPSRRNRILELNSSGGAQQFLSLGQIKKIDIPVPPMELQKTFSEIVEKSELLKAQLKNSLIDLEILYSSLSQRAFKGELDLSELVIDHIIPVSKGGSHSQENLQAISKKENIKKADKLPKELKEDKRFGDPFEVDEETAKKQGGWFYKEWKKLHAPKKKSKITWDRVSTEQVANWIKENYTGYHFTSEMLIRFLTDEHVTFPDYYSSEELKKNPKANDADDLKTLIFSSLNNENPFLKLEQVFYNPELDNVNLTLRDEDFELIKNRTRQERTGVYLRIAK